MAAEVPVKTKSLEGISDLTLLAPIRSGLIDGPDTRTYETRLRILLKTLNTLRVAAREYAPMRPFVDTIERIQTIHSFRLAIVGEADAPKLLLAVTFDRPWEPYIRLIHRDLGPLLDVIFCNCQGYVTARGHSFTQYVAWIRGAQAGCEFFFNAGPLTVTDLHYLRQAVHDADTGPARRPEDQGITPARFAALDQAERNEVLSQGMTALAAVHRLTELYVPGTDDGALLWRAARELLADLPPILEWAETHAQGTALAALLLDPRVSEPRAWLRDAPAQAAETAVPDDDPFEIQPGILDADQDRATHGCVLLLAVTDRFKAARWLTLTSEQARTRDGYTHIAFTLEGLRSLNIGQADLDAFPQEFLEGMEARAGLLGDVRANHPRNWSLPERHAEQPGGERVQLSSVHLLVQVRRRIEHTRQPSDRFSPAHPLWGTVHALIPPAIESGVDILAVQTLRRHSDNGVTREAFGFADGMSQPRPTACPHAGAQAAPATPHDTDAVPLGDVLLGRSSSLDPRASPVGPLMKDGTFLVVRKLRQNVAALEDFLQQPRHGVDPQQLKARMMGRTVDGQLLVPPGQPVPDGNAFDFRNDPLGAGCPLQSHVRRANPRNGSPGHPVPRILRRGMSYRSAPAHGGEPERGLMFMAYAASMAEQFEVIQRWLAGSNSTGLYSGYADPFLGVPPVDEPHRFRFDDEHGPHSIDLGARSAAQRGQPFVKLEWGGYFFVPSVPGLREIVRQAQAPGAARADHAAEKGQRLIEQLQALERRVGKGASDTWKAVLEDLSYRRAGVTAQVWAAVRERHGGVLRTAYGVLVGEHEQVMAVYDNAQGHHSVCGYMDRMAKSFGPIYLGLDAGADYDRQSAVNATLMKVGEAEAFAVAHKVTRGVMAGFVQGMAALGQAEASLDLKWLCDQVLARLCAAWFGIDGKELVLHGGWTWSTPAEDPPRCPGHFAAPSRYIFQPNPGDKASEVGQAHGQRLRGPMAELIGKKRATAQPPILQTVLDTEADDDQAGRTLIGVLMGFLPTVDGNFRSTAASWLTDRSFWNLQLGLQAGDAADHAQAARVLMPGLVAAMQRSPVPDMVWRTARQAHRLGTVDIEAGDRIVVGILSATQQLQAAGQADLRPVFGGMRSDPGHPQHACPGYAMAMGVLVGMLAGLMATPGLRPNPAPLVLSVKRLAQPPTD